MPGPSSATSTQSSPEPAVEVRSPFRPGRRTSRVVREDENGLLDLAGVDPQLPLGVQARDPGLRAPLPNQDLHASRQLGKERLGADDLGLLRQRGRVRSGEEQELLAQPGHAVRFLQDLAVLAVAVHLHADLCVDAQHG